MKNLCFCFQMHVPSRLRRYRFTEIGTDHYYYDDLQTEELVMWMVNTSWLPLCRTIAEMIRLSKKRFRCGLAVTGTTLELLEQYVPEMIDLLKQLAESGCVEMVATPYAYSLAAEYDAEEFALQLQMHRNKVAEMFGVSSSVLWNTELLYSDEIAALAYKLGYKTVMTEGAKHVLSWKSPDKVYYSSVGAKQKVLLRNMALSDSLSFHFSDPSWSDYPMDAGKFIGMLCDGKDSDGVVNLWMGAEAFGIMQNAATGIFDFLKALPYFALERNMRFLTPSEAAKAAAEETVSVHYPMSWAGEGKDLSVFNGNDLQQEALKKLYAVVERVHLCSDKQLKENWLQLQDINHLHYMNHVERGRSNYDSAYEAFINYMNVLSDFLQLVDEQYPTTVENEELNSLLKTIANQEKELAALKQQLKDLKRKKQK